MNRNTRIFCFLVIALTVLAGCSSGPSDASKKAATPLDKIQGKAQVLTESGATDAALNAGGPSVYLWEGMRRYRLFFKTPVEIVHGNEYVAEGVYAQKAIDDIGDPDQGKNGYPLQASCEHVVKAAWSNLAFDDFDANVSLVKGVIQRYPARALFLVVRLRPATDKDTTAATTASKIEPAAADKSVPEVTVAADKQRALLVEGPTVEPAPLWNPAGGSVSCQVVINTEGKISELQTGKQLCESVPWSQFRYQPTVQHGKPVKVDTEVEVKFEPRKP